MPLTLLFCHGWGFDARAWDPLAALLDEFAQVRDDAGYFGHPHTLMPSGRILAITHSLGTMRLLAAPPPGLVGLVAINGFDRFTAAPDFPGTPRRLVERMISALAQEPETVLADFHARIGSSVPAGAPDGGRLHDGLQTLSTGDLRAQAAMLQVPVLSLQGAADPLLTLAQRETVFAAVSGVMRRTHPSAGHLLICDDPQWCADAICTFVSRLP